MQYNYNQIKYSGTSISQDSKEMHFFQLIKNITTKDLSYQTIGEKNPLKEFLKMFKSTVTSFELFVT